MAKREWAQVAELNNTEEGYTIQQWQDVFEGLAHMYGKDAIIASDAGYNNVEFYIKNF